MCRDGPRTLVVVTIFGICAVTFTVAMYVVERRGRGNIVARVVGWLLFSVNGCLARDCPLGLAEIVDLDCPGPLS